MLSVFLAPFSWLYGAVVRFRNFLYDKGLKKSHSFNQSVICVGNLNVGGTGKTPMIEYLVKLLSDDHNVAILSRGYGRRTHGFRLASEKENTSTIGDEPFQFYSKFKTKVTVAVCESRVEGIQQLTKINPSLNVILLDDAFQHRAVRPLYSVLLTEFSKPFFNDKVLPQGRLREPRSGSGRADVIVVTKCGDITEDMTEAYENSIEKWAGKKQVCFSEIGYIHPQSLNGDDRLANEIVLVTGIANSKPLEDYVSINSVIKYHFRFADHHDYSVIDIERIQHKATEMNASILTTEKDIVKLRNLPIDKKLWFYLPIETRFVKNGSEFDRMLCEKIENFLSAKR